MSLVLINPPVSRYDNAELSPPLSLLRLAQTARSQGIETSLIDLNLPPHREMADYPESYNDYVLELVARSGASEVGITSMGVNSHVAISLANLIHEQLGIPVVLGGIHLSSIPEVVEALCPTLACLATPSLRKSPESYGKWWASDLDKLKDENQAASEVRDLYSSVDLEAYFAFNRRRVANFESGRGCKYRCAFCYSPATHSSWSNKNAEYVSAAFEALGDLGFRHIFLVQDNLLNERLWFETLVQELSRVGTLPSWNGYATLPDLKSSMLPGLAAAGCNNLYIGVDGVSEAQQKAWNKRFLRGSNLLLDLVRAAVDVGITITCAFIIDPDPSAELPTISSLETALLLRSVGAEIRLSVMTPYPGTKLFRTSDLVYSEERTAVLMDLPEVVVRNPYAPLYIDAFPWHSRPSFARNWQEFLLAVSAAQTFLNSADEGVSDSFAYSGASFWRHCQAVAAHVAALDQIHKTELKAVLCSSSCMLKGGTDAY